MANNVVAFSAATGNQNWVQITSIPVIASCTVLSLSSNSADVQIRYDGGTAVWLSPGQSIDLERVDLSLLETKGGGVGGKLTVICGSW